MSEANSIAGTVGAWVGGLIVLLITYFVAYKLRRITTSGDQERNLLLRRNNDEMVKLRLINQATLEVLQRIEKIALEVKNESGDMLVLQRVPRSSTQEELLLRSRELSGSRRWGSWPSISLPLFQLLKLDLNSLASVRSCAQEFLSKSNTLNVLINNAGIMACAEGRTADGYETQFGTNHLAHFLLFQLLKPTLLASSTPEFQSRVVAVSSSGHHRSGVHLDNLNLENGAYQPFTAYGQSKTANIYMANEIERRYGEKGLHGLSLHPGGIWTGLQVHVSAETKKSWTESEAAKKGMKSVEQGAATTVWAAVAKEWEGKGGKYLDDCQVGKPAEHTYDEEKEGKLWVESLKMLGEKDDR